MKSKNRQPRLQWLARFPKVSGFVFCALFAGLPLAETWAGQEQPDALELEIRPAMDESKRLEALHEQNEADLEEKHKKVLRVVGVLGEIQGLTRWAATEYRDQLTGSVMTLEMRGCLDYLNSLADLSRAPKIADMNDRLEQMQGCFLDYLANTGRVTRTTVPVRNATGKATSRNAVRIGVFTVVSSGQLIVWLPEEQTFSELHVQPDSVSVCEVRAFEEATSGAQPMEIDPTGGHLLRLFMSIEESARSTLSGRLKRFLFASRPDDSGCER